METKPMMSKYHKMDKYPNIFGCHIFTEKISKNICTPDTAQIQIIFYGNFIQYLNIHTYH